MYQTIRRKVTAGVLQNERAGNCSKKSSLSRAGTHHPGTQDDKKRSVLKVFSCKGECKEGSLTVRIGKKSPLPVPHQVRWEGESCFWPKGGGKRRVITGITGEKHVEGLKMGVLLSDFRHASLLNMEVAVGREARGTNRGIAIGPLVERKGAVRATRLGWG